MKNIKAFSLIELSIVLIIIGLLVAGVTGGASLIQSAKIRSAFNEVNGWRQGVHIFYASKERLPGDLNNDGVIGWCNGIGCTATSTSTTSTSTHETYTISSFPSPFDTKIARSTNASFIDLYLAGISDHKPDPDLIDQDIRDGRTIPLSKVFNGYTVFETFLGYAPTSGAWLEGFKDGKVVVYYGRTTINPKFAKQLDIKYDDGIHNEGNLRIYCLNKNYDLAVEEKENCTTLAYVVFK